MFKIVILRGGLGNQMFGYAFFCSLKKRYPLSIIVTDIFDSFTAHTGYELHRIFGIYPEINRGKCLKIRRIYTKYFTKFFFKHIVELESNYGMFDNNVVSDKNIFSVYDGFWQSELYFKKIESLLRKKFQFNKALLSDKSLALLREINAENSVSIHIRRGDYLNYDTIFGGICTQEYYLNAIKFISLKVENPVFYIFSDDYDWVTSNFIVQNSKYVTSNSGSDSWQDMCLMSFCKHNIIANSSFSWWGAWLNNNKNKIVVAPNRWFKAIEAKDIIPSTWYRI